MGGPVLLEELEEGVLTLTLNRPERLAFFTQLPSCLIGMEACSGAHY